MSNAISLLQDEHELARIIADMPWNKIDVDGLQEQETRIRKQIERIESNPELSQLQAELKQLSQQATAENKNQYQAENDLNNAQLAVQAEQSWLDTHGNTDFDDSTLSSMVSNLLADAYDNCFGASVRTQDRPKLIAGLYDHDNETPFHTRALRNISRIARTRIQEINARANQLRADTERIMDDYLKNHSTDDNTVMASVEDYQYFLDELDELNMLVTRAATDEEYANSVKKLYMSFQQLNRALRTDEENIKEQLNRINSMLKGQQFGPRGGRLSLDVTFSPTDRQFETSLSRILSKLEDWTRNATNNPTETRKTFNNCETFINKLNNELEKIHDTNSIKEYGARNLDPRVRSSFYAIVHHTNAPDERISSTGGKSGGALQELTSFVYGAASSTYSAETSPHTPPTLRSSSTKHSSKPTAATPNAHSPYCHDSASKSSSPPQKAKPRKSSTSPTEHTWHTRTQPPATHTCRNLTARPTRPHRDTTMGKQHTTNRTAVRNHDRNEVS